MGSSESNELHENTNLVQDYSATSDPSCYSDDGNYLLVLFKETPILMAIGVGEFLQEAQLIGAEHFKYLEPITIVGALFLLLSYPSAILINKLEKRAKLGFSARNELKG